MKNMNIEKERSIKEAEGHVTIGEGSMIVSERSTMIHNGSVTIKEGFRQLVKDLQ